MLKHLKLIHHQHTGQLKPHEHTSYLTLLALVAIVGVILGLFTYSAYADTPYTGPESGSIGLTGQMPGKPPTTAAVITSPHNGQHFSSTPIEVSGTCEKDVLVVIYKNDIFAGSTICDSTGHFSVKIDLLFGKNVLKARVYDALNQAGPDSATVTVYYDASLPQGVAPGVIDFTGAQFLLNTDAVYRGTFPGQTLNVPISVIGGTPPFAINVLWGDSTNQVIPRGNNTTFNASHVYKKPGIYKITLQGSDSKGLYAYLSVAVIINGTPEKLVASSSKISTNKLLMLWPIFAIIVTAIICFWLGEKREKKILAAKQKPSTPAFGTVPQSPPQSTA